MYIVHYWSKTSWPHSLLSERCKPYEKCERTRKIRSRSTTFYKLRVVIWSQRQECSIGFDRKSASDCADLLRLHSTVGVDAECFSTAQLPFFDLDSTLRHSCRNSFVTLKTEKLLVIGQIIVFYINGSDDMVLVKMYKVIRAHKPQLAFKGLPAAYFEVLETSLQHRFRQSQISDKLLPMPHDGKLFMIPIMQHFEHDWK